MKIKRFEDIQAWQEARILVKLLLNSIKENASLDKNFRFKDQLTSSGISIMANIAEGFSRHSNKEFVRFLFIAKASAAEFQSHLYAALDQNYIQKSRFDELYEQADKVARLISNFITYLLSTTKHTKKSINSITQ